MSWFLQWLSTQAGSEHRHGHNAVSGRRLLLPQPRYADANRRCLEKERDPRLDLVVAQIVVDGSFCNATRAASSRVDGRPSVKLANLRFTYAVDALGENATFACKRMLFLSVLSLDRHDERLAVDRRDFANFWIHPEVRPIC